MNRPTSDRYGPLLTFVLVLSIIGALNWGLIGFFNWNLVDAILGGGAREETSALSRVIYALVGLAGLALAFMLPSLRQPAGAKRGVVTGPAERRAT